MVSKEDITQLAKLSRLHVSESEVESLRSELGSILEYVEQLSQVDVGDVEPMSHVHGLHSVMRDDEITSEVDSDRYIEAAPDSKGRHIKVPIVIE